MTARPETLNPPQTAAGQSLGAMPCSGRVVVVGGLSANHRQTMLALTMAAHCELIVLPEHFMPPGNAKTITDLEIFKASQEPKLDDWLPLKKSKRERTHPNEPFYRKLTKRRRLW